MCTHVVVATITRVQPSRLSTATLPTAASSTYITIDGAGLGGSALADTLSVNVSCVQPLLQLSQWGATRLVARFAPTSRWVPGAGSDTRCDVIVRTATQGDAVARGALTLFDRTHLREVM